MKTNRLVGGQASSKKGGAKMKSRRPMRTKAFNSVTYHFFGSRETKLEAEREAHRLKKKGYKARVYAVSKFEFAIYSRPSTPWYAPAILIRRAKQGLGRDKAPRITPKTPRLRR